MARRLQPLLGDMQDAHNFSWAQIFVWITIGETSANLRGPPIKMVKPGDGWFGLRRYFLLGSGSWKHMGSGLNAPE
jgi:hypothetical protein